MQTKNILLFMLLSFGSIVGWSLFQSWMWRPPHKVPDATATPPGVTAKVEPPKKETPKVEPKVEPPKIVKRPEPTGPPVEIPLGDDTFKLKVNLTTLGGGVKDVTLTQFQAADKWGRPDFNEITGNPVPLHLVPGSGLPSYLVYHYAKPDDNRPVDTLGSMIWKIKQPKTIAPDSIQSVVFEAELPEQKLRLLKTFTLGPGDYHIGLKLRIERTGPPGPDTPKLKYQLTGAHGLPIEGGWYTYTYRNALVGGVDPKENGWRVLEDSRQLSLWGGGELQLKGDKTISYGGVAIQYFASVVAVDDQQPPGGKTDFVAAARATLEQAAIKGKVVSFDPFSFTIQVQGKQKFTFELAPGDEIRQQFNEYIKMGQGVAVVWTADGDRLIATQLRSEEETNPLFYDDVTVRLISEPQELKEQQAIEHNYVLYNGPVKVALLGQLVGDRAVAPELVERYEKALHLNTLTDYHSPGWGGTFASSIGLSFLIIKFTNLMHWLLWHLHQIIPVWGLCIIALTVIVRGIMFPVSRRQTNNQMAMQEKMAKLAPEVKKLEEKHKGDPTALNQAKTELYLRHGINPLSTLGGCLLMFAQLPVFLGLYYALQESIHFRLQEFLWIKNLAAPDMLFEWGTGIWGISTPAAQVNSIVYLGPFFNLLPIVAVGFMIVQQKLMTPPPTDEQQEMQQKMMKWMMVVFGFMFYKIAAGLCIYFIASSLWGVAERKLFPKPKPGAAAGPADAGGNPPRPSRAERAAGTNGKDAPPENGFRQRMWQKWQNLLKEAGKQQQARSDRSDDRGDRDRGKKKKRR